MATVRLGRDHGNVAHEYFLPSGPFAILPLTDQRASLVWTETTRRGEALRTASDEAFHAHLLRRFGVELDGAKVVVIGRGVTVGRPISLMLTARDVNATTVLCHTGTKDLAAETREADIVIAAAGQPHMLTADMIKEGAALLDVGVSRVDGKLTGDIHPDCWDKAGFVSPNPGGVGPLTRAFLVRNIVERAEKLA